MFQKNPRLAPRRRRTTPLAVAATTLALTGLGAASAQAQVNFYVAASIDISGATDSVNFPGQYIGTNPSAVAWNGSTAYIGGYNSSGAAGNAGIIAVNVANGVGTLGAASFGALSVPNTRGITSLAVQGTTLGVSLDNGSASGDSVRAFNTASNALLWRIGDATAGNDSSRRGNGVAFDPGFNGAPAGAGLAYLTLSGSGRRHLLDPATGQYKFGQNAGMIIKESGGGSNVWRDVAFDPATGDLYAREANRLVKSVRTGDNADANPAAAAAYIGSSLTVQNAVDNQNLAFVNAFTGVGNFVLLNDRPSTAVGAATSFLKAFDTSGNPLALNFFDANGTFAFANSAGAYDFSWNQATQTLAMTDFANRRLYILSSNAAAAVPEPSTLGLLAVGLVGASGVGLRRRKKATTV